VRETRSGDGGRTGGEQKVKTRRQEEIGWGAGKLQGSPKHMCENKI
jgi:hypothetical protein